VAVAGVEEYKRPGGEIVKSKLVELTVFLRAVRDELVENHPFGGAKAPTCLIFIARKRRWMSPIWSRARGNLA
jgi:hypothetical protein